MLQDLQTSKKVVGIKQLRKALKDGLAKTVFLARDADTKLTEPIAHLCTEQGVPCIWVETMGELGRACTIDIGTAAACTLHSCQGQ